MSPLARLRRARWLAGAVLLALVGLPTLLLAVRFGLRHWPFLVGAAAILLLLAGWVERLWQSRPLVPARPRSLKQGRFRVVRGGKGNGEDLGMDPEDETDEPRWLM